MRSEVKMQLRLPIEIRDALAQDAKNNERSMNAQIIVILKEHLRTAGLAVDAREGANPARK